MSIYLPAFHLWDSILSVLFSFNSLAKWYLVSTCFVRLLNFLFLINFKQLWLSSKICVVFCFSSRNSSNRCRIHKHSWHASANAIYSDSVEDKATHVCFRHPQLIVAFKYWNIYNRCLIFCPFYSLPSQHQHILSNHHFYCGCLLWVHNPLYLSGTARLSSHPSSQQAMDAYCFDSVWWHLLLYLALYLQLIIKEPRLIVDIFHCFPLKVDLESSCNPGPKVH